MFMDTDTDIDLLMILDGEEIEHCQSKHLAKQDQICTGTPVYSQVYCMGQHLVCEAHAKYIRWCEKYKIRCCNCHTWDCVTLVPL